MPSFIHVLGRKLVKSPSPGGAGPGEAMKTGVKVGEGWTKEKPVFGEGVLVGQQLSWGKPRKNCKCEGKGGPHPMFRRGDGLCGGEWNITGRYSVRAPQKIC